MGKNLHARHSTGRALNADSIKVAGKNCAVTWWCHAQVLRKHTQQLEPNSVSSGGLGCRRFDFSDDSHHTVATEYWIDRI